MALEQHEGGQYITILGGKFCQRVKEGTPGATQRVNKVGKTVSEAYYDKFTGKLVNIRVTEDGVYGKSWVFSFKDGDDVYKLQLNYANGYAGTFLKILPNVDLTKDLTITPTSKEENGKIKTSLFVNQGGEALKHFYTKGDPKGLPQWKQIEVKGQKQWDNTEELDFLWNMVKTDILPKLEQPTERTEEANSSGFPEADDEIKVADMDF